MIAVIDYKAGNLDERGEGARRILVRETTGGHAGSPEIVRSAASKIVLPGVGHFRATAVVGGAWD